MPSTPAAMTSPRSASTRCRWTSPPPTRCPDRRGGESYESMATGGRPADGRWSTSACGTRRWPASSRARDPRAHRVRRRVRDRDGRPQRRAARRRRRATGATSSRSARVRRHRPPARLGDPRRRDHLLCRRRGRRRHRPTRAWSSWRPRPTRPSSWSTSAPSTAPPATCRCWSTTPLPPRCCRTRPHGAALVLHSATKYLGGHGDAMGGVVACDERWAAALRRVRAVTGGCCTRWAPTCSTAAWPPCRCGCARSRKPPARSPAGSPSTRLSARCTTPAFPSATRGGLVGRQMRGPGAMVAFAWGRVRRSHALHRGGHTLHARRLASAGSTPSCSTRPR